MKFLKNTESFIFNALLKSICKLYCFIFFQIEEIFPDIEKEVIKTVFEANRGNKETTINSLLQMVE